MKKLSLAVVAVAALTLAPMVAQATDGYVCRVNQYNFGGFGTNGGILVSYNTLPNCGGSFQYTGYVCSAGSTSASCSATSYYIYSEAQLQSLFQRFVEAGYTGKKVNYVNSGTTCRTGATTCMEHFNFYSN
jgi:hypothetical protein